jgi:hypothetical protein
MDFALIPTLVILGLLGIGAALVIIGTITKNRWGINLNLMSCPHCGAPLPKIRKPKNMRQTFWGGGTCNECGIEFDKWGRRVKT